MLKLLLSLKILNFYQKIKKIFPWTNVTIAKKKTYTSLIANLNILLKTTKIILTKIKFRKEKKFKKKKTNKRL